MAHGRNEPCWCGSGQKYKKCHLHRDKQKPIDKAKIFKQLNSFYDYKVCSVPDSMKHECTKDIIKAHSVSKGSSLKEISKNGHVLTTFKATTINEKSIKIEPKKIGINRASTFTGFCSYHDNSLFSDIEDKDFEVSELSCFLIAYRAIARELFVKKRATSTFDMAKNLDKGKSLPFQKKFQAMHNHLSQNNDLSTTDLEYIKNIFDTCYVSSDYTSIQHLILTLDAAPKVMTSAVVAPLFDFQGNIVQTTTNDPNQIPDYLIVNAFSSNGIGYIVLSWLEEHKKACAQLYKSLMKSSSPASSLVIFIFALIENIYLSEEWWEGLEQGDRDMLINIFSQGITSPIYNDVLVTEKKYEAFNIIDTASICFNYESL